MFYSSNLTITCGTTEATAIKTKVPCTAGVIHQIDILFPVNSNREIYVKILHSSYQLIPCNQNEAIRANNTVVSTREFYELPPGGSILTIKAWNVHATDDFLISVNIGILPMRILQPFSFKELLAAALGVGEPAEQE